MIQELGISLFFNRLQENNKNLAQDPYSVPKEVWFLVDRLYRHGIKTAGLFETPGLHGEIITIRDWLDTGSQEAMRILQKFCFIHFFFFSIFTRLLSLTVFF